MVVGGLRVVYGLNVVCVCDGVRILACGRVCVCMCGVMVVGVVLVVLRWHSVRLSVGARPVAGVLVVGGWLAGVFRSHFGSRPWPCPVRRARCALASPLAFPQASGP